MACSVVFFYYKLFYKQTTSNERGERREERGGRREERGDHFKKIELPRSDHVYLINLSLLR